MSTYARIKQTVTTRQAAERYGLPVNRSSMVKCPFHEDHNPSMKVDDRFYCFGCGVSGDVIDFTARLFGVSLKDAAKKLAEDFNINPRPPAQSDIPNCHAEPTRDRERLCMAVGNIFGIFVSGSCGIVLRSQVTQSIPALPRR